MHFFKSVKRGNGRHVWRSLAGRTITVFPCPGIIDVASPCLSLGNYMKGDVFYACIKRHIIVGIGYCTARGEGYGLQFVVCGIIGILLIALRGVT